MKLQSEGSRRAGRAAGHLPGPREHPPHRVRPSRLGILPREVKTFYHHPLSGLPILRLSFILQLTDPLDLITIQYTVPPQEQFLIKKKNLKLKCNILTIVN